MEIELSKIPEELTQFSEAKTQISEIASKCQNVIISDESSLNFAKQLAKDAKRIENLIESVRNTVTEPFLSQQRAIKRYADNLVSELETSIEGLRNNIKSYELQNESENNSLQDNWVFELVNLSEVPFTFLCLDEKKVKEAIINKIRNIPGLKIYNDPKLTLAKGKF